MTTQPPSASPFGIISDVQDDDEILQRFAHLATWKRGAQRAPHKPLLILLALARVQRGEDRLVPYTTIESPFSRLLVDFGPPRKRVHPEYPFWRLQHDAEIWDVPERDLLAGTLSATGDASVRRLRAVGARGGFSSALDAALRARPSLVNRITAMLLNEHFPPSLHEDLLDAVGMPWVVTSRRRRDPAFREQILRIYEHRCAVCGFDGRLGYADLCLEAAHVRWHSAGGPDQAENGLALCTFHHKAFDRGAIGLDDARRVQVSQEVHGHTGVAELLLRFIGRPIATPQAGARPPALDFIRWHQRQVFRAPARASA